MHTSGGTVEGIVPVDKQTHTRFAYEHDWVAACFISRTHSNLGLAVVVRVHITIVGNKETVPTKSNRARIDAYADPSLDSIIVAGGNVPSVVFAHENTCGIVPQ